MVSAKKKGYRTERKIRKFFESHGWKVVRAGGSLGQVDLICIKNKKCLLFQIKSKRDEKLYYYGPIVDRVEGFPFYLIVDFGYGNIRIVKPKEIVGMEDGLALKEFIKKK